MNFRLLSLFWLFCFSSLFGEASGYPDFESTPYLDERAREEIRPFLLPPSAKHVLDAIFHSSHVVHDDQSLIDAGFNILYAQPRSFIRVASHPLLPGILIKANLDTDTRLKRGVPSWKWFVQRCVGARDIKNAIKKYRIKHFTVPKKYIYPLPLFTDAQVSEQVDPKPVILIVEDMKLVSKLENIHAWKTKITRRHLHELYLVIRETGGSSYRPRNIWYTTKGKFAFIDTEYPSRKADFRGIRRYLSSKMRSYWDRLVDSGGISLRVAVEVAK